MYSAFRLLSSIVLVVALVGSSRADGVAASRDADARLVRGAGAVQTRTWDTFVADVTVSRRQITMAGLPVGEAPGMATFRWERSRLPTGWKTTFTLIKREGPTAEGSGGTVGLFVAGPAAARLELESSGGPLRLSDRNGRELKLPSVDEVQKALGIGLDTNQVFQRLQSPGRSVAAQAVVDDGWVDNFVLRADRSDERRAALVRQFGSNPRRYQGRDRFVRASGDVVQEVLVDPSSNVPMEINLARSGALETHATYSYSQDRDGSFTRQGIHVEHRLPGAEQDRRVTDIAFSNVRFELRGGR